MLFLVHAYSPSDIEAPRVRQHQRQHIGIGGQFSKHDTTTATPAAAFRCNQHSIEKLIVVMQILMLFLVHAYSPLTWKRQ